MDEAEARMWWYRALHLRLAEALAQVTGPVLDAGCGTGGLLAVLRRRHPGRAHMGLEYDHDAALRAAAKSGARIVQGSVNEMPFADGAFAAIVSADVLCHAAVDPAAALAGMRRALRPGGRLVLNLPAFQWLFSAHDRRVHNVRRFTAGGARAMLRGAGFACVQVRYWNGLLLPLMILQRKIVARRGESASDVAVFSPWLDATLHGITSLERRLPFPLPAGGSVLAVATREDTP